MCSWRVLNCFKYFIECKKQALIQNLITLHVYGKLKKIKLSMDITLPSKGNATLDLGAHMAPIWGQQPHRGKHNNSLTVQHSREATKNSDLNVWYFCLALYI